MKKGSFRKLFVIALTALFLLSAFPAATVAAKDRPSVGRVEASGPLCITAPLMVTGQRGPLVTATGEVLESVAYDGLGGAAPALWQSDEALFDNAYVKVTLTDMLFIVNPRTGTFRELFNGDIEVFTANGDALTGTVRGSLTGSIPADGGLLAPDAEFSFVWDMSGAGVEASGRGSGQLDELGGLCGSAQTKGISKA